ncbi:MAG: alanine--glyoxylate aminotransferase family protein, partial [bacterium]|nr:alanine--glyoxylate aminotransferase family protein [bacterium]
MKKRYLLTPGPVEVPPKVLLAMAQPMIHHRAPDYIPLFREVNEGLKYVFQTNNIVLTFASSGTGTMEAAVVNILSPGEKVITVQGGKFGERWTEICKAYGANPVVLDIPWGEAVTPDAIEQKLKENPDTKAVYITLCETCTGVVTDAAAIGAVVKNYPAVLVVDAISALGSIPCKTDEWNLDIVVSGSQKALMIPPGLAFCSVSDKAWKLVEQSKMPKFYWSFKAGKKNLDKDQTAFTPAISLTVGLKETLAMIKEEGIENVWARHHRLASAMRAGVVALGLQLYAKTPADTVTAINVPAGIDGKAWTKLLRDKYGLTVAGGQAQLEGKIIRIAQMGYSDTFDVIIALSALELSLSDLGYPVKL